MPCLHNFCTIGSATMLANPRYLEIVYSMCKKVVNLSFYGLFRQRDES